MLLHHVVTGRRGSRSRADEIGDDTQVSAQGGHRQISSAGPGAGKAGVESRERNRDAASHGARVDRVDAALAQLEGHSLGRAESAQGDRTPGTSDHLP